MKDEAEDATIAPTETSEVRRLFRLQEAALPPAEEAVAEETAEPEPPTIVRAITVEPGDTLMQLLVSAGADRTQAHQAVTAMEPVYSARHLRPGQELAVAFADLGNDAPGPLQIGRASCRERVGQYV